jgi:tRNA1(Val) A37 N6-methylase TrmN6
MQSSHSEDSIYRKDIRILQPLKGYRFALDAVLLVHFIKTREQDEILEVGAGSGVVTILLSALQIFRLGFAIEIQPELAELCRMNFENNAVHKVQVLEGDFNELQLSSNSLDLIFCNPPYRKAGSGKLNSMQQKSIARHEIKLKLEDLFRRSQTLLRQDGRLTLILPQYREKDFLRLSRKYGMHLIERQYVHSFENQPPAFLLSSVCKTESEFIERERIIIYNKPGEYTQQMKRLL